MAMDKLDINSLKTPMDIPVGTILTQHWCNSSTFYKIVGTTKKSVLVVQMPSKTTHFEHEGGGTGYSYKTIDEDRLANLEAQYKAFKEKYGFDPLSNKATQADFENAHKKFGSETFWHDFGDISNCRAALTPKRIMVKPAKNGGFYIPGVIRGSWCGNMNLWNGEDISDYYN